MKTCTVVAILCAWTCLAAPSSKSAAAMRTRGFDPFERIRLTKPDGQQTTLAAYRAPVMVIAAWATWCKPCLEEMPYIDELYRRHRGQSDVSILAINVDQLKGDDLTTDPEKVQQVVRGAKLRIPVLIDDRGDFTGQILGSHRLLPILVFIDRDSKILRETGFKPDMEEFISNKESTIKLARQGRLSRETLQTDLPERKKGKIRVHHLALEGENPLEALSKIRTALKKLYPDATDTEIEEMIAPADEAMCGGPTSEVHTSPGTGGTHKR